MASSMDYAHESHSIISAQHFGMGRVWLEITIPASVQVVLFC